jgi:hypothetical protein
VPLNLKKKKKTKPFLVVGHLVLIRVERVHTHIEVIAVVYYHVLQLLMLIGLLFRQLNSILGRKDK